jgi:hypothetical protein
VQREVGLDEAVLSCVFGVGGIPGDEVRGAEGDLLMCTDEFRVCGAVTAASGLDQG